MKKIVFVEKSYVIKRFLICWAGWRLYGDFFSVLQLRFVKSKNEKQTIQQKNRHRSDSPKVRLTGISQKGKQWLKKKKMRKDVQPHYSTGKYKLKPIMSHLFKPNNWKKLQPRGQCQVFGEYVHQWGYLYPACQSVNCISHLQK